MQYLTPKLETALKKFKKISKLMTRLFKGQTNEVNTVNSLNFKTSRIVQLKTISIGYCEEIKLKTTTHTKRENISPRDRLASSVENNETYISP